MVWVEHVFDLELDSLVDDALDGLEVAGPEQGHDLGVHPAHHPLLQRVDEVEFLGHKDQPDLVPDVRLYPLEEIVQNHLLFMLHQLLGVPDQEDVLLRLIPNEPVQLRQPKLVIHHDLPRQLIHVLDPPLRASPLGVHVLGQLVHQLRDEGRVGGMQQAVHLNDFAVEDLILDPMGEASLADEGWPADESGFANDALVMPIIIFVDLGHPLGVEGEVRGEAVYEEWSDGEVFSPPHIVFELLVGLQPLFVELRCRFGPLHYGGLNYIICT